MPVATRTFRVFVSSTFEDLKEERNALQKDVFPALRRLCELHGARFQAIDLRWGVRDEAALDQKTVEICLREIDRCQKTGIKPNFIVLLGRRYGWRPLPARIKADEFLKVLAQVPNADQAGVVEWYEQDDNAIPAEFVLMPRTGDWVDKDRWENEEARLHGILLAGALASRLSEADLIKYWASATHQEILKGLGETEADVRHLFAFCRNVPDKECDLELADLRGFLKGKLSIGNFLTFEPEDLAALCKRVEEELSAIIKSEAASFESRAALELEKEAHDKFARERSLVFGREEVIEEVDGYLRGGDRPLVLHGASGCGKSAIMARASEDVNEAKGSAVLVRRFIGASPESSNGLTLLRSLSEQIGAEYGAKGEIPVEFHAVARLFGEMLKLAKPDKPLVIFIDALDQLGRDDPAHSFYWLAAKLPPHCHVVVSTTELPPALGECAMREIKELHAADAGQALDHWLAKAERRLTHPQREKLLAAFKHCGLPLYLKLAFEEARLWPSSLPPEQCMLGEDVEGVIDTLLDRLSLDANHGERLVNRSLGYLAAARYGLTEDEMLDVLSADEEVWGDFEKRAHHTPPEQRLPVIVWSRLFLDLEPNLAERSARSASVLTFYHRQIGDMARAKYLESNKISWRPHDRLADLFERKADPARNCTWNTASLRALEELPYHLAQSANVPRWERTVCDPLFVEAACRIGLVLEFIRDIDDGLRRLPSSSVRLMRKAAASSLRTIVEHPEFSLSILCNRLTWSEPNELIIQAAKRATSVLDASGPWMRAASPLHTGESIPLGGRSHQAFIPEQQAFATADQNGNLEIRSIEQGEYLARRVLEARSLTALAVESAQFRVAWLERNGDIRAEFSQNVLSGRTHESMLAYPRTDEVIAVSRSGDLVLWNPRTGETSVLVSRIPCPLVVLRANPDGSRMLFVSGDRSSEQTVGILSRSNRGWGAEMLRWNDRPVKHGCLNSEGTRALLVDSSRRVSIVDVASGEILASTQYERRSDVIAWGSITACALGHACESETAVVTTDKGQVWAWNWMSDLFTECGRFKGLQEGAAVQLLEIVPEGRRIFLSMDDRAEFFSMDGGLSAAAHSAAVADCAITESDLVASVCREDRALKWWRFDGLAPLRSFPVEPPRVVAADANEDSVFLGTDNGLLYRFPTDRAPESKDIFRLFDHPVANIVSNGPGVAIAASTQGLIERVDFVADRSDWLCSHTSGHRQRWLLPRAGDAYITVRELDTAGRGDVVALGTGQNRETELYTSKHSAVLVTASPAGEHLVIYDCEFEDDASLKVFSWTANGLTPVFDVKANRSLCAIRLLLGDKYLLLAQRDEPWLELRRLEPGLPVAAVMELHSAPSSLCARQDKIAIGFQSGDLLCLRLHDFTLAKPIGQL